MSDSRVKRGMVVGAKVYRHLLDSRMVPDTWQVPIETMLGSYIGDPEIMLHLRSHLYPPGKL